MKTNKTLWTSGIEHRLHEIDSAESRTVDGGFLDAALLYGAYKLNQYLCKVLMEPDHDDHPIEPLT